MSYELYGIWHCDHCGLPRSECQKLSKIIGLCKDYNAAADDPALAKYNFPIKSLGITDDEAMKMKRVM